MKYSVICMLWWLGNCHNIKGGQPKLNDIPKNNFKPAAPVNVSSSLEVTQLEISVSSLRPVKESFMLFPDPFYL